LVGGGCVVGVGGPPQNPQPPNPQSPIPNPQSPCVNFSKNKL